MVSQERAIVAGESLFVYASASLQKMGAPSVLKTVDCQFNQNVEKFYFSFLYKKCTKTPLVRSIMRFWRG